MNSPTSNTRPIAPLRVIRYSNFCADDDPRSIVCECGYMGFLKRRDRDQPHGKLWEWYTLEGFKGRDADCEGFCRNRKELLVWLQPKCPQCGKAGGVRFS